jgi:Protein of unknown function (DUF664)
MADTKPTRTAADERETLHALLQYCRDSFVRKLDGIDEQAARRELLPTATTLLWLTRHLAYAEDIWVAQRFAGEVSGHAEADTLAGAIDHYRTTCARTDAIVAAASFDDECRNIDVEPNVNLRWVVVHLIEETARHAGHADVIRELLDGATGR